MADKIIVNHEIMKDVSKKFDDIHEIAVQHIKKFGMVQTKFIDEGPWKGLGMESFAEEFSDEIAPAWNRLMHALDDASNLASNLSEDFNTVDKEA